MTEPTAEQGQWLVRWDGYTRWQVFEPLGKPSEEGTQAIRLIAECRERTVADAIIANAALVPELLAALREIRYQASHGMYLSSQRRTELEAFIDAALAQAEASQPPETTA